MILPPGFFQITGQAVSKIQSVNHAQKLREWREYMIFTKMQGCGNDYIYIDETQENISGKEQLAVRLSNRHFGIGGDGVIFIRRSTIADFEMEMYNADGSRGKMCGNGIRCVAKYVYDHHLTDKNPLTIESCGSVKHLYLFIENGKVDRVRVDMGEPELRAQYIPVNLSGIQGTADPEGRLIRVPIVVDGRTENITAVSMGNPHAVLFVEDPDVLDLPGTGPLFECHEAFPERVNTEFVTVIDRSHLKMRVWERGSAETLACGTGACASVVAAVLNGKTDRKVQVQLLGGVLEIEWSSADGHVYMTGPAREVFTGSWDSEA